MLISVRHPMMVVIDMVVVISMVMVVVVVHPLMIVMVVFFSWSGRPGFGKNCFVRFVARLESLRSVHQAIELYVSEPLGLFRHPVLDNVDVLNCPKSLEI